jgi:hypothetical protein
MNAARLSPNHEQFVLLRIEWEPRDATEQQTAHTVCFVLSHANANILNQQLLIGFKSATDIIVPRYHKAMP